MHTLRTLFALALLAASLHTGRAYAQSSAGTIAGHVTDEFAVSLSFTVQDGTQSINMVGTYAFTILDSALVHRARRDGYDFDWYRLAVASAGTLVDWQATTGASGFSFSESGPITRCDTGTLKEVRFEMAGKPIRVQKCSTEDGPLTVVPGTIGYDGPDPNFIQDSFFDIHLGGGGGGAGSDCYYDEELEMCVCP